MSLEKKYCKNLIEAGCDEAGRGCLAGPVVAAAVILPDDFESDLLNDSKKLSKNRNILRTIIEENALYWQVAFVEPQKIDEINILNASFLAMHKALDKLSKKPEHILIDGNRFKPYKKIPHKCIIKGDGKYYSIAAASILAKTYRDEFMEKAHEEFPYYNWKNKGYPTQEHRAAIKQYGDCIYHRKSFKLLEHQLELFS